MTARTQGAAAIEVMAVTAAVWFGYKALKLVEPSGWRSGR